MLTFTPQDRRKIAADLQRYSDEDRVDGPCADRPDSTGYPVEAYFLRRCPSLKDALKVYRALGIASWQRSRSSKAWKTLLPDSMFVIPGRKTPKERREYLAHVVRELRRARGRALDRVILSAIGPDQFSRTRAALLEMCRYAPATEPTELTRTHDFRERVTWELRRFILPLVDGYEDPSRFFREVAPQLYPQDFIVLPRQRTGIFVTSVIKRWGLIALMNDRVHRAVQRGSPDVVRRLQRMSVVGTKTIRPGRTVGAKDSKPRKRDENMVQKGPVFLATRDTISTEGLPLERRNKLDQILKKHGIFNEVDKVRETQHPRRAGEAAMKFLKEKFGWTPEQIRFSLKVGRARLKQRKQARAISGPTAIGASHQK